MVGSHCRIWILALSDCLIGVVLALPHGRISTAFSRRRQIRQDQIQNRRAAVRRTQADDATPEPGPSTRGTRSSPRTRLLQICPGQQTKENTARARRPRQRREETETVRAPLSPCHRKRLKRPATRTLVRGAQPLLASDVQPRQERILPSHRHTIARHPNPSRGKSPILPSSAPFSPHQPAVS